jgi:hypothetical protein
MPLLVHPFHVVQKDTIHYRATAIREPAYLLPVSLAKSGSSAFSAKCVIAPPRYGGAPFRSTNPKSLAILLSLSATRLGTVARMRTLPLGGRPFFFRLFIACVLRIYTKPVHFHLQNAYRRSERQIKLLAVSINEFVEIVLKCSDLIPFVHALTLSPSSSTV